MKNKTALITGSTHGIGFAIAKELLNEGARVFINGRKNDSMQKAVEELKQAVPGGNADGVAADFSKVDEVNALMDKLPAVDILVNNVGAFGPRPFETTGDDQWFSDFEINVMSGVRLSRHYAPLMRKKGWGRIIFISSESAINIPPDMITYGMTKTAHLAVSRGLAKHLKGTGVTVNAILPGPTLTEGNLEMLHKMADEHNVSLDEAKQIFMNEKRPSSLIQRFATPEEVAHLVVYTASALSSATTGAALRVEGGIVNTAF